MGIYGSFMNMLTHLVGQTPDEMNEKCSTVPQAILVALGPQSFRPRPKGTNLGFSFPPISSTSSRCTSDPGVIRWELQLDKFEGYVNILTEIAEIVRSPRARASERIARSASLSHLNPFGGKKLWSASHKTILAASKMGT